MGFWRIVNSAGAEVDLDTLGMFVTAHQGAGMAAVRNVASEYGISDGAFYQRTVVPPRVLTLTIRAIGASLADLHSKRLQLLNLIRPDRVAVQAPLELRYNRSGTARRLMVVYDGGLEIGELQGFSEQIALRFLAYDPYWQATTTQSTALTVRTKTAPLSHRVYLRSTAGQWSNLPTAVINPQPYAMAFSLNGAILYAGGDNGGAGEYVVAIPAAGGAATTLAGLGSFCQALAIGPDGTLYAGTNSNVRRWDGAAWVTLGTLSGQVFSLVIGPDGLLYAGGAFTNNVAVWDGASWTTLSGIGGTVRKLVVGPDNLLYAGTDATGVVRRWNGSSWSTLGSGLTGTHCQGLVFGADGTLYAAPHSNATTAVVSAWNGTSWRTIGTISNAAVSFTAVYDLAVSSTGLVYAAGSFVAINGLSIYSGLAVWNGFSWSVIDARLTAFTTTTRVLPRSDGALYVCGPTTLASYSGVTTVTNNGSAAVQPTLTANGPGRLYQLTNYTSGDIIYFNLVLNNGESATLDFARRIFTSTFRGNLLSTIIPGSSIATFRLLPGANSVSFFFDNDIGPAPTASLGWRERFWSVD